MEQRVHGPGSNALFLVLVIWVSACRPDGRSGHQPVYYDADRYATTIGNGIRCLEGKPLNGVYFRLDEGGDTLFILPYLEGIEHGTQYTYYGNGRLRSRGTMVNGWKQGKFESWYPDGKIRYTCNFQDDVYEGELCEWYPGGTIFKRMNYRNGQEYGLQRLWYENGKIRANYVVKGDRVYGLIGALGCSNSVIK